MADEVSPQLLRELLWYSPTEAKLYWVHRGREHFNCDLQYLAWNGRWSGREALACIDASGYRTGRIFGRLYYAHRVIFAIIHGRWPELTDHIDQDKLNNRIDNLREVTRSENGCNVRLQARNKSGYTGVRWNCGAWQARITHQGREYYLGRFQNIFEAARARKAKEVELGFSPLHGAP